MFNTYICMYNIPFQYFNIQCSVFSVCVFSIILRISWKRIEHANESILCKHERAKTNLWVYENAKMSNYSNILGKLCRLLKNQHEIGVLCTTFIHGIIRIRLSHRVNKRLTLFTLWVILIIPCFHTVPNILKSTLRP